MARLVAALLLALAGGCERSGSSGEAVDITAPRPEVYPEGASDFTGEWVGESAGIFGTLSIQRLASDRYYGRFTSEDGLTRFVINLRQDRATPVAGGAMEPGNLVRFTWQDGRGGRGEGWVLINRENSALSGEIRYGGLGAWDFVRTDAPGLAAPGEAPAAGPGERGDEERATS
ncbi:hypothetical protein [Nannocystis sp. SCPEA4]|uniref:hypothetical protein n=1 Tax=Nannocystis sp. SCPEA4 TaxID=2996787 RepID=UPI002271600E|nr:hypothetical protein [Nannocystis sp. SCPEA4]MCY1063102.1 hypothetical protein [Nannocystis sp. SCPEA4]